MRLLTSTDLALRVLMRLSAEPDEHVSTDVLARDLAVSRHHLHKIVQYLTEVGLVRTIRSCRARCVPICAGVHAAVACSVSQ